MNIVSNSNRLRAINVFFVPYYLKIYMIKMYITSLKEYICMHIYGQVPAVIKYFFFNK